jgi:hypothetical protein
MLQQKGATLYSIAITVLIVYFDYHSKVSYRKQGYLRETVKQKTFLERILNDTHVLAEGHELFVFGELQSFLDVVKAFFQAA